MKSYAEINEWYNREKEKMEADYKKKMDRLAEMDRKASAAFADPNVSGDEIVAMMKEMAKELG